MSDDKDFEPIRVTVRKKMLIVYHATEPMELQRAVDISRRNNGKDKPPKAYEGMDEGVVNYVHRLLYPSLLACTRGQVPSEDDFVLVVAKEESQKWEEAVKKQNPDWLPNANQSEEEVKQKEKKGS